MSKKQMHDRKTILRVTWGEGDPVVVVDTFNPTIQEARGRQIFQFQVSLVYRASSRTAMATQRNPVSKTQSKKSKLASVSLWLLVSP